jgi:PBSX family phage portal protein
MSNNRITRTARPSKERSITATARTITINRADHSTSNQSVYVDQMEAILNGSGMAGTVLPTPFDIPQLYQMISRSSMLPQCIDAMVVNTVESGWEVKPLSKKITVDPDEEDELESFVTRANTEESLAGVMSKVVRDRESVGFGFMEVIRDRGGNISLLRHAPSLTTRLTARHQKEVPVKYDVPRGKRTAVVTEYKLFRKYVQLVGGKLIFFREFGDPRKMDSVTGAFEGEPGFPLGDVKLATEIYHTRLPSNDAYGLPRWLSQIPSMIGSREAEEVNMRFFEDNTIPPAMITVSGGRLTAASYQEIQRVINTGTGKERQNKMILIEAVGDGDTIDKGASPITIHIEKLTSERPSDGLFKTYKEGNQADLRSSFRLPPISVGMSQDANFATANVSQFVAEAQVFAPARQREDEALNNLIVHGRNGLRLKTVKLVARPPSISSPEMTMKALTALNVMGAVTPRSAQIVANALLQIELPPYPEKGEDGYEDWMDMPMPLSMKASGAAEVPANTHDEQAGKDAAGKALEANGNVAPASPEHGQE